MSFEVQFQREVNRVLDNDRNTRKKGLQKLFESLPWTSKKEREGLLSYLFTAVIKVILQAISDPVEKCREYSLKILQKITEIWKEVNYEVLVEITNKLTERINDTPFPEPAEELRLLIAEILKKIIEKDCEMKIALNNLNDGRIAERISIVLVKFLGDNFPQVKRTLGELICVLVDVNRSFVKPYLKKILKGLEVNALHQHAKTRSVSIQAIARCIIYLESTAYEKILNENILPLFKKLLSDRSPSVKLELGEVLQYVLHQRILSCQKLQTPLLLVDFQLIVILLILHGDQIEEISEKGKKCLSLALRNWKADTIPLSDESFSSQKRSADEDIEDAEAALQQISIQVEEERIVEEQKDPLAFEQLRQFFILYLTPISAFILEGTENWTNESKIMYISSLKVFIEYTGEAIDQEGLPTILSSLYHHVREDDHDVRQVVEACIRKLGSISQFSTVLDFILPTVVGEKANEGESISQRIGAVRVLTEILKGYKLKLSSAENEDKATLLSLLERIVVQLTAPSMLNSREIFLREALLLLLRAFIDSFSNEIKLSQEVQQHLAVLFMYLRGKCPYEQDTVAEVAERELLKLSKLFMAVFSSTANATAVLSSEEGKEVINEFVGRQYLFVLNHILSVSAGNPPSLLRSFEELKVGINEGKLIPKWDHLSPQKAAFEALVNDGPLQSWVNIELLLPIFHKYIKPKESPAHGTTEANMQSYASQRGEEKIPTLEEIDIRLNFIVLLENMIRYTSNHWESSKYLAQSCEKMMKELIIPNLIWRVGRVESTIRKISLAVCYHILKSGAVSYEILAKLAGELVPLLISHLDDSETSIRLMTCLSLTVIFDRLPHLFADQSVNDLYPKLISRLDDHSDELRIAICTTLEKFFMCGVNERCYHNTMLDYILTQLYIHLDDSNELLQTAIAKLIIFIGQTFPEQEDTILQRAETSRLSHRTPKLCDQIIFELKGIEILP